MNILFSIPEKYHFMSLELIIDKYEYNIYTILILSYFSNINKYIYSEGVTLYKTPKKSDHEIIRLFLDYMSF